MPGNILIIDSVPTNRILLKVKLCAASYRVCQASSETEAHRVLERERPDLVVMNGDWQDQDSGIEICRRLKASPAGAHTPFLMLSSDTSPTRRKEALRARTDDILCKPVDELELLARIRSLMRSRDPSDGLALQDGAAEALGFAEPATTTFVPQARVLLAAPDAITGARWKLGLQPMVPFAVSSHPVADLLRGLSKQPPPDALVIALPPDHLEEGLRLLAEVRARTTTRHARVLVLLPPQGRELYADALDLGADDIMTEGFDTEEIALRLSRLVQRKRLADRFRQNVREGLEAAIIDPLTGLHNRRYALPHLARIAELAHATGRDFAVMVADLDHFKQINDRYGHGVGDKVLRAVARRLRRSLTPSDLLARIGGEEFLIAMPATCPARAQSAADTLCQAVRSAPVFIKERELNIPVTISIGIAMARDVDLSGADVAETLLEGADRALYGAKSTGRDQVTLNSPAA
jgi:two-component system cell cycle response regulator